VRVKPEVGGIGGSTHRLLHLGSRGRPRGKKGSNLACAPGGRRFFIDLNDSWWVGEGFRLVSDIPL
jgi:hypothetical protein